MQAAIQKLLVKNQGALEKVKTKLRDEGRKSVGKYRNKLPGNIACKSKGKWIDSVTKQELLSYQVYKQVSLFAKIK